MNPGTHEALSPFFLLILFTWPIEPANILLQDEVEKYHHCIAEQGITNNQGMPSKETSPNQE
jgi:hypothetical protein